VWWLHRLASAACGAALLVGTSSVAHADYWYASDPTGDVTQTTHDPDPEPCGTDTVTSLPDDTSHDITQLRLTHGLTRVVVSVRLRDLVAAGRNFTAVTLRTDGRDFWLDALRFANGRVEFFLIRKPRRLPPPDECGRSSVLSFDWPCRRYAGRWDADADLVRFAVPRVCIGNPAWVSASASSYTIRGGSTFVEDRWEPVAGFGFFTPRVLGG
jgi:hypothetical protein